VFLCIVTIAYSPEWSSDYIKRKVREIQQSNGKLGITQTISLKYPTVKLDTIPQKELNDAFSRIITDIKPDIVFLPQNGDLNKDHRIVYEAALVASRLFSAVIKKILAYETLSKTEWGRSLSPFKPDVYFVITGYLELKNKAMSVFKSELKSAPHPRSLDLIAALAEKRGSEAGIKYAEAFMLIREII